MPRNVLGFTDDDRTILRLALPALGALAAEPLVALVDTAFVGRLDEVSLAALGVVTGLLGLAFFVFVTLAYAGTPLIAAALSLGQRERAALLAGQSMLIGVVLALVGMSVVEVAAPQLVRLMGAAPEVEPAAVTYLRIRGVGLAALPAIMVGHAVYRGLGNTRTPMYVTLAFSMINVVLDPLFIFGLGWGLAGAGYASVVAQWVGGAAFLYLLYRGRTGLDIRWVTPRLSDMGELIGAGSALLIRTFSLVTTLTVATATAARLGVTEVAAHQVIAQLWAVLSFVVDSVAIAAQNLVAIHLARDRATARRLGRRMLQWGGAWGVLLGGSFWLLRDTIPGWFTSDPSVALVAASLMPIVAAGQPVSSVVYVLDGIMIGAARFRFLALAMIGAAALTCTLLVMADSISQVWLAMIVLMVARVIPLGWGYVRAVT